MTGTTHRGRRDAGREHDLGGPDDDTDAGAAGEYVYLPPEPGPRARTLLWVAGGFVVALFVVAALGAFWVLRQIDPGTAGDPVVFEVPEGASVAEVALLLEQQGVVTNARIFELYARWRDLGSVDAGEYDGLSTNSAMATVVDRLEAGPLPPRFTTITIPEGFWLAETRARILATFPQMDPAELDAAFATVRSAYQPEGVDTLEGLIFPATYQVPHGSEADEEALVRQMVDAFDATAAEIGLGQASERLAGAAGDLTITPYEVVIVASLIEEEARLAHERPKIARVIYNRLARGERLGIDATVLYALGEHTEELTQSQLEIDSPFNTRRFEGLPPTPIAAPGRASLEAALNPAEGPWTFYVLADESGAHFFTDDYDEFLRVKRESQERGVF